mgnify:CR=1 FL=1
MGKTVAETIKEISYNHTNKNNGVIMGQCLSAVGWVQNTVPAQKKGIIEFPMTDVAGAGFAVGAAIAGARPIFILRFQSFLWLNASPLINHAAKAKEIFGSAFPKIITVSRLDRRKGHQNILMTIKNLVPSYPDIKYVCVGEGDEKKNLDKLKNQLGLEQHVFFLPKTEEKLKVALLNEANLFLMPSIIYKKSVEGFGISFIEAGSYGKASIGGMHGGEADAIEDGRTGYLCDGNDLNSIYETVLNFFQNDNYKILGLQAKEFSKKFKWKNIVKQYLSLV